jgi:hypothetical protein
MNLSVRAALFGAAVGLLAACGGGISHNSTTTGGAGPVSAQVSGSSPFSSSCGSTVPTGSNETFTLGSSVQPQIAAIPSGNLVGVWEQDRWSGLGARGILAAHSADGGATWSTAQTLPFSACGGAGPGAGYDRASDPWITFAGGGVVYASALAFSANGYAASGGFSGTSGGLSAVLVSRSADGGVTWGTPVAVWTDTNPNAAGPFYFNDRDSITADPASGSVYVVWDRLPSANTLSAAAYLAYSKDAGTTWTAGVMFDPGAGNEAFNNQIVVLSNGQLLDFFTLNPGTFSGAPLQVINSSNGGVSWSTTAVTVASIVPVGTTNPITNGSIRDSPFMAQVAADPAGNNVAAVWQQSFGTGSFDGIALSVSKDNGQTWSTPKQINGVTSVAAFNPSVRYLPGSVLAVTYYDFRDYVSGSSVLSTSVWLTESNDGGATWHELRQQSPFDLNQAPLANLNGSGELFLGDNQGLTLVSGNALPFYAATNSAGAHIYATQSPSPLNSSTAHVY